MTLEFKNAYFHDNGSAVDPFGFKVKSVSSSKFSQTKIGNAKDSAYTGDIKSQNSNPLSS